MSKPDPKMPRVTTYTYRLDEPLPPIEYVGAVVTYTYDSSGNLVSVEGGDPPARERDVPSIPAYRLDANGRLLGVDHGDGGVVRFDR